MKRSVRLTALLLILALGMTLGACAPRQKPAKASDGKTLFRLGFSGTPDSLNPYAAGNEEAAAVMALLYDTLFAVDPETGEYTGSICAEWTVSDAAARGGRLWKLTLVPDACWHDGEPLTASDVEFSLQSMRDFSTRYSCPDLEYIDVTGIALEDDTHLAFISWGSDQAVLECLSHVPVVPRHIWNDVRGVEYGSSGVPRDFVRGGTNLRSVEPDAETMIGSGLYVWDGYADGICSLRLNDRYWGGGSPAQRVELCFGCADPAQLLRTRQLDACWDMSGSAYEQLGGEGGYALTAGTAGELYYLAINHASGEGSTSALSSREVRMAVDYALDHAGLMNRAFGGGIPALGLLPPYSPWNYEESLSAPRDYSPDSARWLLENAGFTLPEGGSIRVSDRGQELRFTLTYSSAVPAWGYAAGEIRRSLAEVGIGIEERPLPPKELMDAVAGGDYELLLTGVRSYNDPFYLLGMYYWNKGGNALSLEGLHEIVSPGWNASGYQNREYDALYEQMLYAEPSVRRELTTRLGDILYLDAAVIPLGFRASYQAGNAAWTGLDPYRGEGLFFTPEMLRWQLQNMSAGGRR